MNLYEIKAYSTLKDFKDRQGELLDEGIPTKREANKVGKQTFKKGKYAVIKVQSYDREYINILSK